MKKIYILTIHHIHNFGSVLQASALFLFLKEKGFDVEIIDYRPKYYKFGNSKLKTLVGIALNFRAYHYRKNK